QYGPLHFEAPEFAFDEGAYGNLLEAGLHASIVSGEISVEEVCSASLNEVDRWDLLAWKPPPQLASRLALQRFASPAVREVEADAREVPKELPVPSEPANGYLFVRYRRQDGKRIAPTLDALASRGISLWYDREIAVGSEWDARIEERIERCAA